MSTTAINIDKEWFYRLGQGEEAAFRTLFHTYTPLLYPSVVEIVKQPEVAREIIQDVFMKVWQKKELVSNMDNPNAWIFRVASNLAISHLRKVASHLKWLEQEQQSILYSTNDATDKLSFKELQKLLHDAINSLPPKRKLIFQLSREEGLSNEEIAERLELSKSTVKNQLVIAGKHVQAFLNDKQSFFSVNVIFFLMKSGPF